MKVAITGAGGFIGTWLAEEYRDAGHSVVGCDREIRASLLMDEVDLLNPGAAEQWIRQAAPDLLVHLAAQVGRAFGEDDVRHTVRTNAEMTTVIARTCGELGVRLAYVSTSEVYGDQGDRVVYENTPWRLPHNLYGLTKRWGEEVARLYAPDRLVIARLSMPYGPGAPPGRGRRAMDTMLWQAHHRMPITVHRGAERSWCWVGDTVRGIRLATEGGCNPRHPVAFNIGRDDDPREMRDLADLACVIVGVPEGERADLIRMVDPPAAQTVVKRLDTFRLRSLGWAPTVELTEGMVRVYEYVRHFDRDGAPVHPAREQNVSGPAA